MTVFSLKNKYETTKQILWSDNKQVPNYLWQLLSTMNHMMKKKNFALEHWNRKANDDDDDTNNYCTGIFREMLVNNGKYLYNV